MDGIEVNPFMAFMAKVKARDYSRVSGIEEVAMECLQQRRRGEQFILPRNSTLVERRGLDKWLLNRSVALRFEQLRTAIAAIEPATRRDLLLFALLSSIEDVANARKDGKCWRYKTGWKQKKIRSSELDESFAAQVLRFIEDIEINPKLRGKTRVLQGDARMGFKPKDTVLYDGLLTSPPYLNSFDYTDIYRPELLMMQAARDSSELRALRFNTVRSHVQVAWKPSDQLDIAPLKKCIGNISSTALWNGKIPDMINAYFVDIDKVIYECSLRLRRNATAAFVVADSAYSGVVVPVGEIVGELLERRGFKIDHINTLRMTLGNGNHQSRSTSKLSEVMVVAKYRSKISPRSAQRRR